MQLITISLFKPNQEGKLEEEEEDVAMLKKKLEEARTEVESINRKRVVKSGLALGSPGWLVVRHQAKKASHTRKCLLSASHRSIDFSKPRWTRKRESLVLQSFA